MKSCVLALFLLAFGLPAFANGNPPMGAERHMAKGVPCAACHGANKEVPYPTIAQCRQCHNPDTVAETTKNVQPRNPHVSPHYGNELDCALCHLQHEKPENYCAQCHDFAFEVR